jgi:hypothetical protein
MREVKREQTEMVASDPTPDDIVTTTDPVTGQVVHVNRTTGEVVTRSGMTQTIYRSRTDATLGTGNLSTGNLGTGRSPAGDSIRHRQVEQIVDDPSATQRMRIYKGEQVIYLIFGIVEALIAIRLILRLLAANPVAGFASFIYGITDPLVAPFVGLFTTPAYNGNVLELTSIVAIIVYALVAWLLVRVLWLAAGEDRRGVRTTTERIDRRIE